MLFQDICSSSEHYTYAKKKNCFVFTHNKSDLYTNVTLDHKTSFKSLPGVNL